MHEDVELHMVTFINFIEAVIILIPDHQPE